MIAISISLYHLILDQAKSIMAEQSRLVKESSLKEMNQKLRKALADLEMKIFSHEQVLLDSLMKQIGNFNRNKMQLH